MGNPENRDDEGAAERRESELEKMRSVKSLDELASCLGMPENEELFRLRNRALCAMIPGMTHEAFMNIYDAYLKQVDILTEKLLGAKTRASVSIALASFWHQGGGKFGMEENFRDAYAIIYNQLCTEEREIEKGDQSPQRIANYRFYFAALERIELLAKEFGIRSLESAAF